MQVKTTKTFQVEEPVAQVWEFLKDPRKVAACVPGAQITEALDDRRYAGTITVKVGPVVSDYKGELSIERLDAQNYEIELLGKGRDVKGKGSASMKMAGKLRALPGGGTEVTGTSEISIIGVLAQFGSRVVEEVSSQMFGEFTTALQKNLQKIRKSGNRIIVNIAQRSSFARHCHNKNYPKILSQTHRTQSRASIVVEA